MASDLAASTPFPSSAKNAAVKWRVIRSGACLYVGLRSPTVRIRIARRLTVTLLLAFRGDTPCWRVDNGTHTKRERTWEPTSACASRDFAISRLRSSDSRRERLQGEAEKFFLATLRQLTFRSNLWFWHATNSLGLQNIALFSSYFSTTFLFSPFFI